MRALLLLCFVASSTLPAQAQLGFGLRGGADFEPDAFFVGGHAVVRNVANVIDIEPSVEIGFGSHELTGGIGGISGGSASTHSPLQAYGVAADDLSFTVLRANPTRCTPSTSPAPARPRSTPSSGWASIRSSTKTTPSFRRNGRPKWA